MNEKYNVYLVSDSTGETLDRIFLSLKSQFANFEYEKKEFESNNIFDDESLKISIKFDNSFNRDYGISLKKSSDYEVLQLDLNFYF